MFCLILRVFPAGKKDALGLQVFVTFVVAVVVAAAGLDICNKLSKARPASQLAAGAAASCKPGHGQGLHQQQQHDSNCCTGSRSMQANLTRHVAPAKRPCGK